MALSVGRRNRTVLTCGISTPSLNILTVKISEKNYELVKIFSRKNNQYTKDNFTKSELVDMGLTLLFKELNNIKVKDLKIRPSIKKYDVKKYLNDGCDSNE